MPGATRPAAISLASVHPDHGVSRPAHHLGDSPPVGLPGPREPPRAPRRPRPPPAVDTAPLPQPQRPQSREPPHESRAVDPDRRRVKASGGHGDGLVGVDAELWRGTVRLVLPVLVPGAESSGAPATPGVNGSTARQGDRVAVPAGDLGGGTGRAGPGNSGGGARLVPAAGLEPAAGPLSSAPGQGRVEGRVARCSWRARGGRQAFDLGGGGLEEGAALARSPPEAEPAGLVPSPRQNAPPWTVKVLVLGW